MRAIYSFYFVLISLVSCTHSESTKINENDKKIQSAKDQDAKKTKFSKQMSRANSLAMDGLYREALGEYKSILKQDKNNALANKMVGIILVKTGDYKNAIKRLEKSASQIPSDYEINFYLAEALRTQDRYADAIFRYKIALNEKPKSVNTMKALAWSYYKIRYYKAALETSIELSKKAPKDPQSKIILARVLNKLNKSKKALSILKQAAEGAPKDQRPYLLSVMGDVLYSMDKKEKAANIYKNALKDQPLLAGALLGLAKITLEKGERPDIAITLLERAGRIKPSLVETFFYLGQAHKKTKPRLSKRYFRKFRKLANGDPEYSEQLSEARTMIKKMRRKEM